MATHPTPLPFRLILASGSFGRRWLMQQAGYSFDVKPANIDEPTEARLGEVAIPTLVVFGTRDAQIPSAMGRVYRERMPRCQYVLVYDAGHEVSVDRPEAFSTLVADFLRRHEVSMVSQRSSQLLP